MESPAPGFAKQKAGGEPGQPKNEITAKVASNYIALPKLHMPVEVDANRQFRALELEVWLLPKVNALLKPATLKMALLASVMPAELVIKPLPLKASVPALMAVAPV